MNENQHGAKYAFYYLLSLVSLIFVGIAVGLIAFGIIDKTVVDPLANIYYGNRDGGLRFAISALLIAGPIYYYSLFLINRGLKRNELKIDSQIRKWLTYFIILVSILIILGVFISIINNFLAGELSLKFFLKALSMLLISGLVFSYYFHDIKVEDRNLARKMKKIFLGLSLIFVGAAFISVWFFVESPKEARMRRLDQNLLTNINILENAINSFYADKGALPEDISELKNTNYYFEQNSFIDPETGKSIEYKKTGDKSFEFCATFRTSSNFNDVNNRSVSMPTYGPSDKNYEAGYNCLKGNLWSEPIEKARINP
ncbi:hypothetical protein GW758_02925 [Candidatus Falkowbacteria bacterium]|nr:hypothetical protein [Candidatus Falkowbacteria bacterium]NCT54882.1 hypothetical protein [Candidatus Falkowbacteria bacterium]